MLKNKKILLIILSFIFILLFNTSVFATNLYTSSLPEELSDYTYIVAHPITVDGELFLHYYASNTPFIAKYSDGEYNIHATSYFRGLIVNTTYYKVIDNGYWEVTEENPYSFVMKGYLIDFSSHDISYSEDSGDTGIFFQERRGGASSDNSSPDSGGTGESGNIQTDTERTGFFSSVITWFSNLFNSITQGFADVISYFANLLSYLNPFHENFILKGVLNFLGEMLSYLNPFHENFLGKKLVELLENVIKAIFVPDEEKINTLVHSVKSKFEFVDTIKFAISDLKNFLANIDESDNITMNLSNKYFTGNVTILNLSWFVAHKTYSDNIITAFIYIFYLWRLFIKLPGAISGLSGSTKTEERGA